MKCITSCIPMVSSAAAQRLTLFSPLRLHSADFAAQVNAALSLPFAPQGALADSSSAQIVLERGELKAEGYAFEADGGKLKITAADSGGAFYALVTLFQLLEPRGEGFVLCAATLSDSPRFGWRGLLLDIARHFFTPVEIMRVIDIMAFYKLNRLHLHLCDDQGFRLEIKKYPQLTDVGSRRAGTQKSILCRRIVADERRNGFLTQEQARCLVRYAAERGIQILPEIDLPGHTGAVLAAMPQLSCSGQPRAVRERFGISSSVLCAGNEQVYEVVCGILAEVFDIFPFPYIHLGGDEVRTEEWERCPKCAELKRREGIAEWDGLREHMFERVRQFAAQRGRTVIGWNEAISQTLDQSVVNEHWESFNKAQVAKTVSEINGGRPAIISEFTKLYFDYPHAMTPLRSVYEFEPQLDGIASDERILGAECCMWTEWVRSFDKLTFNLLPRLAAAAELMWRRREQKDYADFTQRLQKHYALYENAKLCYAKKADKSARGICRAAGTAAFALNPDFELNKR